MENKIILHLTPGRLGNFLWEYFVTISLCKLYNKELLGVYFKDFCNDEYITNIINKIIPNINIISDISKYDNFEVINTVMPIEFTLYDKTNYIFYGYFQDKKYLDKTTILQSINIHNDIKQQIFNLYGDISNYVCCHVRRGDYLASYNGNNTLYNVWTKGDLVNVINTYFPNNKIIFISDDILWCKENFKGDNYVFADKSNDVLIDFCIQLLCKDNIISNSSFSFLGSIFKYKYK